MVEVMMVPSSNGCGEGGGGAGSEGKAEDGQQQAQGQGQGQVLALVLAALRKSVVLPCQMADADDPAGAAWGMEIGWPTDVRHVAHVTFDRLHGFLGLPVEFELEIPGQVPSARSVRVWEPPALLSPLLSCAQLMLMPGCSVRARLLMFSFEFVQRQRIRGVAGVDAVWL